VHVLHELNLHSYIRAEITLEAYLSERGSNFSQDYVDLLCCSLLAHASLHFGAPDELPLMNHKDLIEVLADWCQNNDHHKTDPGHNTDLSGSIAVMLLWRGLIPGELHPRRPNQTSQTTSGLIHNSLGRECPSLMEIVLELPNGSPV
jgi:hypothetical protein